MNDPLLNQIITRDRRFRITQTIFSVVVILGLILIGILVWAGIQANFDRLNQLNQTRRNETQAQIDQLSAYTKCLATVFAANTTGTVTITDIDHCQLRVDSSGHTIPPTGFSPTPPATSAQTPTPAATAAPSASTPATTDNTSPTPPSTLQKAVQAADKLVTKITGIKL